MAGIFRLYLLFLAVNLIYALPSVHGQSFQKTESTTTTAIDTLQENQFNEGLILNVQELLKGKVPGLIVSRPGSNPDEWIDMRIRGLSSLESAVTPLIVIDDVITKSFDSVDPLDIQKIEILKDAASSARYGILGNAGVIRITTKGGEPSSGGTPSMRYHGTISSSFRANQVEVLDAGEFRVFNAAHAPNPGPDFGSETNWQNEVSQTGLSHFHNLAITGGSETSTYRVSGISRSNETILKGSDNQHLGARFNFTHRMFDDRLFLNGGLSLSNYETSFGLAEVFRYAATFNPTAPVRDDEDNFFETTGFDIFNPVSILEQSVTEMERRQTSFRLSGRYDLDHLVNGLGAGVLYSRESQSLNRNEYYGPDLLFKGQDNNGFAIVAENEIKKDFFEALITHRFPTGSMNVTTQAGFNSLAFENSEEFISGGDVSGSADLDNSTGTTNNSSTENRVLAWFGQIDASYEETFFSSVILRHEGSTRLGENNKWGTFYGFSAGVEWSKIVDTPLFDRLYTRAGYGKTGQDAPFDGISRMRMDEGPPFFNGSNFVPSLVVVSNPNPDLKWEEKKEFNLGVDLSFLDNRLTASVDYFNNRVDDLIYEIPVSVPPNLYNRKWVNIGEIKNSGFEARLNYRSTLLNGVNWNSTLLYASASSELVSLSNSEYQFDGALYAPPGSPGMGSVMMLRLAEGGEPGQFWGPEFAGFSNEGRWQFKNSAGEIVTAGELTENDYKVIGNGLPDFTLGLNNTFQFSGWEIRMFWQGVFGHDMINVHHLFYENPRMIEAYNITKSARELPLREFPLFSDYYVEDASYFRLQNLVIGYNFNLPDQSALKQFRLYTSGTNLWTITGYSGTDPEVRLSSYTPGGPGGILHERNVLAPGIEYRNVWPTQTTILFGVQLGF